MMALLWHAPTGPYGLVYVVLVNSWTISGKRYMGHQKAIKLCSLWADCILWTRTGHTYLVRRNYISYISYFLLALLVFNNVGQVITSFPAAPGCIKEVQIYLRPEIRYSLRWNILLLWYSLFSLCVISRETFKLT